jgi:hypothetical protein
VWTCFDRTSDEPFLGFNEDDHHAHSFPSTAPVF